MHAEASANRYKDDAARKRAFGSTLRNSMSKNQRHRRVILIFGDPNHGKSHLATQLRDNHGYHVVSLDEVYVKFIQNHYPDFFLPLLREVIAQHYNSIFAQDSSRVASLVSTRCRNY